jgi:hypothetical protein
MYFYIIIEMSNWYLEQQINIKFCVKLEKNACDTCLVPCEARGGETMRKSNVVEWHEWFKESLHVKITNEDNAHYFL